MSFFHEILQAQYLQSEIQINVSKALEFQDLTRTEASIYIFQDIFSTFLCEIIQKLKPISPPYSPAKHIVSPFYS